MSFRSFSAALILTTALGSVASAAPTRPASTPAPASAAADPTGAHAAIAQAQERLAEIDATITVLQDQADQVDAAARQKAHDAVAGLRAIRETYRKEIDGVLAQGRQMTAQQLAVARTALAAPWTQFEQSLDRDVAAIKLDGAQQKAIVEARIKAEQTYWQSVLADLQGAATSLTAEQRAAIDARIARVKARADEAGLRLSRLANAGRSAWSALKQGLVNSRRVFDETYNGTR